MNTLSLILISTTFVSLISLIGVIVLAFNKKTMNNIVFYLVALSAGALIGAAFLHLLPEAIQEYPCENIFAYTLAGFILFFFIEKILHWHHCHKIDCKIHTFAYMNLLGEIVHNFIDGLIIATGFLVSIPLGITTTIAVALHEIPQEIGDFGVLVYGGFSKWRAIFLNFLAALTAISGGLVGYFFFGKTESYISFLLPFAAGGFIYIAASDLFPELRKENDTKKSFFSFIIVLLGILIIYLLKFIH